MQLCPPHPSPLAWPVLRPDLLSATHTRCTLCRRAFVHAVLSSQNTSSLCFASLTLGHCLRPCPASSRAAEDSYPYPMNREGPEREAQLAEPELSGSGSQTGNLSGSHCPCSGHSMAVPFLPLSAGSLVSRPSLQTLAVRHMVPVCLPTGPGSLERASPTRILLEPQTERASIQS